MPPALYQTSSFAQPVSLRRRATSFALAAVANILLLLMLFTLAPSPTPRPDAARKPSTFSLLPDPNVAPTPAPTPKPKRASSSAATEKPVRAPLVPPVAAPLPVPAVAPPLNMIVIGRNDLAALDRAMRVPPTGSAGAGPSNAPGSANGADDGEGTGPGGERLYNAEWQTEPTDAQLAGYLPANGPRTGWGMIACRTVERYQVDDCVEIGQSPAGSGFARAARQAAWQFRVRPPRVGDRRLVGAWVRIRIEYGSEKAK